MTHRVAVVGIDGSGKSDLIATIADRSPDDSVRALPCPDFHQMKDGPLHETSRHLAALGTAADRAGNPIVKAAALYLRMTLFGPVERFVVDTYRPDTLFCERHPLVETMVYAPSYELLASAQRRDVGRSSSAVVAAADAIQPGTATTVARWQALTSSVSGVGGDLETTLEEVVSILSMPFSLAVSRMADCYRTHLPDAVIWIDIPIAEAIQRLQRRGDIREVHETHTGLQRLRYQYTLVLPLLETMGVPVHRVNGGLDRPSLVAACAEFAQSVRTGLSVPHVADIEPEVSQREGS